ncbi:hypothetical protein SETIT_2G337500v2 [Setaria italica]|uniref:DUF295 domain-containing protein n=1 Tax=Setaria italica TaxID=4555 RepID=A0A368Q7T8_SETIT|nr:hypothetical protein SETIT_2G337500v2 [Setaria italica]
MTPNTPSPSPPPTPKAPAPPPPRTRCITWGLKITSTASTTWIQGPAVSDTAGSSSAWADKQGSRSSFVFDAATRLVSAAPPFQSPKKSATFWTAGGTIYALDLNSRDAGESQERCLFERLGPDPQSRYRNWRWEALPPPPFKGDRYLELKSHAVHPDGATVFLSFRNARTFSFDGERLEWARHGRWALPFDGEAYHVRELDAWVGLCSRHRGHLAACQVVGGSRRGGAAKPASKCGKDLLFRHRWKRHIDANLVYKGNAKFCLLETVTREHIDANHWDWDAADLILLRVVTFRVQYSFDGELCVVDRRSRVYELPSNSSGEKPLAFWV